MRGILQGRRRGHAQPPPGAQVNWAHSITKDLLDLWVVSESTMALANLVSGQVGATSTIIPPTAYSHAGRSLLFDGPTTSRFVDAACQARPTGEDYTLWVQCMPTVLAGEEGDVLSYDSQSGATRKFALAATPVAGTGPYAVVMNTGGTGYSAQDPTTPALNKVHTFGYFVRHQDTTLRFFTDGRHTATTAFTGSIRSDFPLVRFGKQLGTLVQQRYTGHIFLAARWRRALLPEEFRLLVDPQVLFADPTPTKSWSILWASHARSAAMPVDWTHALSALLAMPVEWEGAHQYATSHGMPAEWVVALSALRSMPADWVAALRRMPAMPVEWEGDAVLMNFFHVLQELEGQVLPNFFDVLSAIVPLPALDNVFDVYTTPTGLFNAFDILPKTLREARGVVPAGTAAGPAAALRRLGDVQLPVGTVSLDA